MKLSHKLPETLSGCKITETTMLDTIERAYKALFGACKKFACVIADAATFVPTRYAERTWMQSQLFTKIQNASTDLSVCLDELCCHNGRDQEGNPDTEEIAFWSKEPVRYKRSKRADLYAQAKFLDRQAQALREFARVVKNDDGQPDPVIAGWGFCGRPWTSFPKDEKFVIGE